MGAEGEMSDVLNPNHYRSHPSGIECIQITEHFDFNVGNAIKYCWRAGLKSPDPKEDLKKARWYIERELGRIEKFGSSEPAKTRSWALSIASRFLRHFFDVGHR